MEEYTSESQDHYKAWLSDGEELDLEKEHSVSRDYQLIRRLPPSVRSSVESSTDFSTPMETQEGVTKPAEATDLKGI